jgi:hypothetical protein
MSRFGTNCNPQIAVPEPPESVSADDLEEAETKSPKKPLSRWPSFRQIGRPSLNLSERNLAASANKGSCFQGVKEQVFGASMPKAASSNCLDR